MTKGNKIFEFSMPLHNGRKLLGTATVSGNYQDTVNWEITDISGVSLVTYHQYCDEVGAETVNAAVVSQIEYLESLNLKRA